MEETSPQALVEEGVAAFRQEDYERALSAFRAYAAHNPDDPDNWYNLARTYEELGRHREAADAWDQYVGLEDDPARREEGLRQREAARAGQVARAPTTRGGRLLPVAGLAGITYLGWRALRDGARQEAEPEPDADDEAESEPGDEGAA